MDIRLPALLPYGIMSTIRSLRCSVIQTSLKHQIDTNQVSTRLPNRAIEDAGRLDSRSSWGWLEALRTDQWARQWPQGQR